MTSEQFMYWLSGFIEGKNNLNTTEIDTIKQVLEQSKGKPFSLPMTTPFIPSTTRPFGPPYETTCKNS